MALRRKIPLLWVDVLGCRRETLPQLSPCAQHRSLVHRGISNLPRSEE